MNYYVAFINFIFHYIIGGIVKILVGIYEVLKALWMPIYANEHPTTDIIIDWLNGKKTYIVSGAAIIGIAWGFHHGSVDFGNFITTLPVLVVAITIRQGLARSAPTAENEIPPEYNPNYPPFPFHPPCPPPLP